MCAKASGGGKDGGGGGCLLIGTVLLERSSFGKCQGFKYSTPRGTGYERKHPRSTCDACRS